MKNQEWLQTNGLGAFASGMVSGPPRRRYHGLLCASLNPPTDRFMLVSHMLESYQVNGEWQDLSCEHYQHHRPEPTVEPQEFLVSPYPDWHYALTNGVLRKSILMEPSANATLLRYKNEGDMPLTLCLRPLLALRGYHALRTQAEDLNLEVKEDFACIKTNDDLAVFLTTNKGDWQLVDDWYHELYYAEEAARGFAATEENYGPVALTVTLQPQESMVLRFGTEAATATESLFLEHEKSWQTIAKKDQFKAQLKAAAEQFIVVRESTQSPTIIAGYPWFTDWGRDTLIALRDFQDFMSPQAARAMVQTFLNYEQNGLIPNRFPDNPTDEVEYNTVDASLWLFVTVWELQQSRPSVTFLRQIFPRLTRILQCHIAGTDFGIQLTPEGLLTAGAEGVALTWMDANIGGQVITPRRGCAVEINALWYNALQIYRAFAQQLGRDDLSVNRFIQQFETNFIKHFWNVDNKSLYDVVLPGQWRDDSVRPNQIYALSLPFSPLTTAQKKDVLTVIETELYTPLGLRTLPVHHPDFKPLYEGDPWSRDTAYHQGTGWPFLLREYWVAQQNLYGKTKTKARLKTQLEPLKSHFLDDAGVGSVSEIFDGKSPVHGKGCPWQAWSVAALWKMVKLSS